MVLFELGFIEEWVVYKEMLETFCRATGMVVNETKSIFLEYGLDQSTKDHIIDMFPYQCQDVELGFKYLGFVLNPNNYKKEDWYWLLREIEKRIGHWTNRWLSLGGRLILVKFVLENIPVYWMCLSKIPISI